MTTPKYEIGTAVFLPSTDSKTEKLPCPDCLDERQWQATSPAGESYTFSCPRCGNYTYHDLPSLTLTRHFGTVRVAEIFGYEVERDKVIYKAATDPANTCSYNTVEEGAVCTTREAAQQVADLRAADLNRKADATVEVIAKRHLGSLRLDDARFDQFKNGIWAAHYHAGQIIERVRSALFGSERPDSTDPDALRGAKTIFEDLRSAVQYDLSYPVDNMPLAALVVAAAASEDPGIKAALATYPQSVIDMFTKPLAESRQEWSL